MEKITCRFCDTQFDLDEAEQHVTRRCRNLSTPTSVLDAPVSRPVVLSRPAPKVRKVRRGRKARWNRPD